MGNGGLSENAALSASGKTKPDFKAAHHWTIHGYIRVSVQQLCSGNDKSVVTTLRFFVPLSKSGAMVKFRMNFRRTVNVLKHYTRAVRRLKNHHRVRAGNVSIHMSTCSYRFREDNFKF